MDFIFTYRKLRGLFNLLIALLFFSFNSFAQYNSGTLGGGSDGTYSSFPMNTQLYPRDVASNLATIVFSGNVTTYKTNIRVRVFRDDNNDGDYADPGEEKSPILIGNGPISFSVPYQIPAELYTYSFRLAYGTDSYWLDRTNIVAGDVIYVQGQSNAEAKPVTSADNDLANNEAGNARNFVRVYGGGGNTNPQWYVGDGNKNYNQEGNTGQFAMRFASRIVAEKSIPICIMNGAELGHSIDFFLKDAPTDYSGSPSTNPDYGSNNYMHELGRLQQGGLQDYIRAIIWFQGEYNTFNSSNAQKLTAAEYKTSFYKLLNFWKGDFSSVEKYYIIQIKPPGCEGVTSGEAAGEIQEAHRQIDAENSDIEIVSTNNNTQYSDNCHYRYTNSAVAPFYGGYREIGDRITTLLYRDLYGVQNIDPNKFSPFPSSAEFSNKLSQGIANQIIIKFRNPDADLSIINGDVRPLFKLRGGDYTINTVAIENLSSLPAKNYILKIDYTPNGVQPNPTGIAYLSPATGSSTTIPAIVAGGSTGIGMINFSNFPISLGILPVDPLNLRINSNGGSNTIIWEADNNPMFEQFIIERGVTANEFTAIASIRGNLNSGKVTYQQVDYKPNAARNYYRIKAIKIDGKELYSQVVAVNNRTSSVAGISVYPNPVSDRANVSLTLKKAGPATLQIFDPSGRLVSTRQLNLQKGNNMFSAGELLDQSAGIYTLRVVTAEEVFNARVVRVK